MKNTTDPKISILGLKSLFDAVIFFVAGLGVGKEGELSIE